MPYYTRSKDNETPDAPTAVAIDQAPVELEQSVQQQPDVSMFERIMNTLTEQSLAAEQREERMKAELRTESEKTRSTLRQEIDAVRELVDSTQREVGRQREELDDVSRRVVGVEARQDAVEATCAATQTQVSSDVASLAARVDAVQREMYDRICVTQSRPSSVHIDDRVSVPGYMSNGKVRAKPNPYDGKISFPLYRTQFDMVAELNGWSESDKARYLTACLQGQALTVLNTLSASERVDYQRLTAALTERFDQNRSAELALVKLDNRRRNRRESLQNYSADIEQLVVFAYPTVNCDTRDVMTRDRFLRGLDSELRKQIKLARPCTYADTLNVACEIESVLVSEYESTRDRSNRRAVMRVSMPEEEKESDNEYSSSNQRDMSRVTCFNCRKTGHFKRQCREPLLGNNLQRNRANRKRRYSDSDSNRQRSVDDAGNRPESRDETVAGLRAEIDRLAVTVNELMCGQANDSSKNYH